MKKRFFALALCMVLLLLPFATIGAAATTDTGYTLNEKTYTVTTAKGLLAVAAEINAGKNDYNITLAADIDLNGEVWTPIGTLEKIYKGTFDGAGFTIKNLKNSVAAGENALIGQATGGCVVKNLNLTNIEIKTDTNAAAVIGVTLKNAVGLVTIENVHIRNAKIEATTKNYAYAGGFIGQAGTTQTVIKNCSIVATINSMGRAGGVIGGESLKSDATNNFIEIENVIVAGTFSCGVTNKNGTGAGAFLGYHSTMPLKLTNCVTIAELFVADKSSAETGSISFDYNKLSLTVNNCIVNGPLHQHVEDTTLGFVNMTDIFYYKPDETAQTLSILGKEFATNENVSADSEITINGTVVKWANAQIPVINSTSAFRAKVQEMFANNTYFNTAMIEDLIGHEHAYTVELAESAYLKADANCTDAAVYYKSCVCGAFDSNTTFSHGVALGHTPSSKWTNDDDNHWHICSFCLEEKSDEGAHTFGAWVITKEATERKGGERTKTCTVCGYEVTEKTEKLTPAPETNADTDDSSATGEKTGCNGSVFGIGSVIMISVAGAFFFRKKKTF